MSNEPRQADRREFLKNSLRFAATLSVTCLVPATAFAADKLPKLSPDDKMAKSLNYVEDASQATAAAHKKGQHCAVCKFYQGADGSEWGGCQIFQGKRVHSQGWCSSFVATSAG